MHHMLLGRQQKKYDGRSAIVMITPARGLFRVYDKSKKSVYEDSRSKVIKLSGTDFKEIGKGDSISFRGNIKKEILIREIEREIKSIEDIPVENPPPYYVRYGDAIARYALIQERFWPREPGEMPHMKGPFDRHRAFLVHGVISDGTLSYSVINIVQYRQIMWRVKWAERDPLTLSLQHLRDILEQRGFAKEFDFWTANPAVQTIMEGKPPSLNENQQQALSDLLATIRRIEYRGNFEEPQEPLLSLLRAQLREHIQHFVRKQSDKPEENG